MFSIATVASSTRMPTASASPPRVMMLMVSPSALSTMIEVRIDSGIETAMISVLRQLPRKSRIISAVRQAAMIASCTTPSIAARTKTDWSASGLISSSGGSAGSDARQRRLDLVDDVERRGVARLQDRQQRRALAVDAHDVGLRRKPSRTCATSRM